MTAEQVERLRRWWIGRIQSIIESTEGNPEKRFMHAFNAGLRGPDLQNVMQGRLPLELQGPLVNTSRSVH
jgi:hypothetical protein